MAETIRATKIFISYSRKDKELVRKLHAGLVASGLDVWVDWEGIPLTADWMAEITAAIEGADAFVFVISPDSLNSNVCADELALGIKNNKKLVPVLHRVPEKGDPMNPLVGATNWVYLRDTDDFDATLPKLVEAILTDLDWVHLHTRLLQRSVEWEKSGRNPSFLLRGVDLGRAETWQTQAGGQAGREITTLQAEYIQASRQDAQRRQRILLVGVSVALVITVILAIYAFIQRNLAEEQKQIALAQKGVAQAQSQQTLSQIQVSTLLAIQSMQRRASYEADQILRQNLVLLPVPLLQVDHDPASKDDRVDQVVFSPDGKRMVSVGWDGTVRLWDAATGAQLAVMPHEAEVLEVDFSPDGSMVASASSDGTARIWDAASGQELQKLTHDDEVLSLAYAPDGKTLATGSADGTARIWDVISGEELARFTMEDWVDPVAFSPDGQTLATAMGNVVTLWDVAAQEARLTLEHDGVVIALDFSADSTLLATGGDDRIARVWDTTSGEEMTRIVHSDWVEDVAISPDGRWLASASDDNTARLLNLSTGLDFRLPQADAVTKLAFSPDSRWLVTTGKDYTARLWETATGHLSAIMEITAEGGAPAFSPDGTRLAVPATDGVIQVWNLAATIGESMYFEHTELVRALTVSPDGRQVATSSDDFYVYLWGSATAEQLAALEHPDFILDLAFSPDGTQLATGCIDGFVRLWDTASGELLNELSQGEYNFVRAVSYTPDGKYLAVGLEDGSILIWDLAAQASSTLKEPGGEIYALAFSPDGRWLASGDVAGQVALWDWQAGKHLGSVAHEDMVKSLAFSFDGKWLLSGSADGSARRWLVDDLAQGKTGLSPLIMRHDNAVNAVAFSPDARYALTASDDRTLRLWDMSDGQELARLAEYTVANDAAFSPDGQWFVAGSGWLAKIHKLSNLALLRTNDLIPAVCARLTRSLSPDEWARFIGAEDPYGPICPAAASKP